jgi:hypothetical protein
MLLQEKMKKILDLQMSNIEGIDDIQIISDKEYGYIIVLVNENSMYNEILEAKLQNLEGKRIFPDLWVFGPYISNSKTKNEKNSENS